jgi:hypothetical protein
MGATTFFTPARGKSAREAFITARDEEAWEHGHGGYTGTLAEKNDFVEIPLPPGQDPHRFAERLIDEGDERIDDKWGPAGCLKTGDDAYLFFGWAST